MPKLPKRLPYEMLILAALALGSCDYHSSAETYDLADVANANARNALSKIDALESRVDEIEGKLGM